jgi:hypothetical protein
MQGRLVGQCAPGSSRVHPWGLSKRLPANPTSPSLGRRGFHGITSAATPDSTSLGWGGETGLRNPLREICTMRSVSGFLGVKVALDGHATLEPSFPTRITSENRRSDPKVNKPPLERGTHLPAAIRVRLAITEASGQLAGRVPPRPPEAEPERKKEKRAKPASNAPPPISAANCSASRVDLITHRRIDVMIAQALLSEVERT